VCDANSFLLWKSLSNRDNAETVYRTLLDTSVLNADDLSFATECYAFVFFDAFDKDRLALSTLIWTLDPLTLASHDLSCEQHLPGLTVTTTDSLVTFPSPAHHTPFRDADCFTSLHIRNVVPGVPVMFSGVDSTLMAASLALDGSTDAILLNFCANDRAPDRSAARVSCAELRAAFPATRFEKAPGVDGWVRAIAKKLPEIRGLLTPLEVTDMNLNTVMTLLCALERSETFAAGMSCSGDGCECGPTRLLRTRSAST
jgi:hypothetical protein